MNLQSIFVTNGVGVFLLLMLLYTSHARTIRRSFEDRIYTFMILGVLLGCCLEAFSYAIDGKVFPGSRVLNYIANTYLFTVNLLLPFCVLVYIDHGLYGDKKRIWKCYKVHIIIGLIMYAVNIVNLFIPISFYISEQNVYERRPVGYIYYFIILFYCLTGLIVTYRYEKQNGARTFLRMKAFLFPILIGAALQFIFYGLSIAWMASAVGLTCLYIMQQNELAYVDSLVDTYNRQYMSQILSSWNSKGKNAAGVMIDIDHFKQINDKFGHSEGDHALITVTDILKGARDEKELVFRFAGDEFIVLKMDDSEGSLQGYMDRVNRKLEEYNNSAPMYPLELSYGFSCFREGNTDTFLREMDEHMYEMKAEHHQKQKPS